MTNSLGKPLLFGAALFVGAALLFLVQPMIARLVLPKFGGAPAVWNTCLLFFQAALLAGYLYAHAATQWLGVRRQAIVHLALAALPWLVLPVAVDRNYAPPAGVAPTVPLLTLLAVTAGLPFFVVSTGAPLLQKWFAHSGHRAARDPYFLYAASNAGSMLGLLSYPLAIEPRLSLAEQSRLWAGGYALLCALTAACAVVLWRSRADADVETPARPGDAPATTSQKSIGRWTRPRWVLLAFVPSSLMLGVTTFLTTEMAPFPMLWVAPLALYLLSFILVFSRLFGWVHRIAVWALPLAIVWQVYLADPKSPHWFGLLAPSHLAAFFLAAMVCHGELARSRPPTAKLTEFYLWMSLGGVLGGLFNVLAAPLIFTRVIEYPLALLLACALSPPPTGGRLWWSKLLFDEAAGRRWRPGDVAAPVVVGLATGPGLFVAPVGYGLPPLRTIVPALASTHSSAERKPCAAISDNLPEFC